MKIKWLGHSSFLITSEKGQRIITDPYSVIQGISYGPINEEADIVTVSHGHGDHNNSRAIKGNPRLITDAGVKKITGIEIKGVAAHHDEAQGSKRGSNIIFCFAIDGINVCHLGDLGHLLSKQQIAEMVPVDILLVPVGGYFTIDAKQAAAVAESLNAKIIIPMHYKTPKVEYPISKVDEFLKDKGNLRRLSSSEIDIKKDQLPETPEIVVLQYAL